MLYFIKYNFFLGLILLINPAWAIANFSEFKNKYLSSEASLLAEDGRVLQQIRINKTVRKLAWSPLDEISPALQKAVIISEDKRFEAHIGVDVLAVGSAMLGNFWKTSKQNLRGASTITMQLVGLIEKELQQNINDEEGKQKKTQLNPQNRQIRRNLWQKMTQSALAIELETKWSKKEILEAYLNLLGFRGELKGVESMSMGLFGKWSRGLNNAEAAIAAAMIRAPNASAKTISTRACPILMSLANSKELKLCDNLQNLTEISFRAINQKINLTQKNDFNHPQIALHLGNKLLTKAGQQIKTSIDFELQKFSTRVLKQKIAQLQKQNVEDGAVVVIENKSGKVLAWVGSSGELSDAAQVDNVVSLRQAGSTLKPFLYAMAFDEKILTPATLIEDSPLTLDTGNGLYQPQNYEKGYHGWVSVRRALAGSLNIPAVRTLTFLDTEKFLQKLRLLGFSYLQKESDWYGYSLALGSADISLLSLTNAYRALANNGVWSALTLTPQKSKYTNNANKQKQLIPYCQNCQNQFIDKPQNIYSAQASFLVADILSDVNARVITFGRSSWLETPFWSAVKTGTSKDMRDNWCVGFSDKYTVGVWVGNATGEPMFDVSGVSGSAPVWFAIMKYLNQNSKSQKPTPPDNVINQIITFNPEVEAERSEWFVKGTQVAKIEKIENHEVVKINYPNDGTIIALDPDIPPYNQKIQINISTKTVGNWYWQIVSQNKNLNSKSDKLTKSVGFADREIVNNSWWLPMPGKYKLIISDKQGNEIDSSIFTVLALTNSKKNK